ncbi:MAG: hypothetical protein U0T74_13080 [Chitinophagales bacterium]
MNKVKTNPLFAHIINPVLANENKELFEIQKTTFESITAAKNNFSYPDSVTLFTVGRYPSYPFIPSAFSQLYPLTRDISDFVSSQKFKFPFLNDILRSVYENSEAEYIIYTNLDITLMPYFYESVHAYLNNGYDALVINRRRLHNKLSTEKRMEVLYAESGKKHPGYDCFVFRRTLFEKFIKKDICLVAPPACNDLFYNIFTFADNPKLLTDKHLTFHIGLELYKDWGEREHWKANYREYNRFLQEIQPYIDISKFPGADLPLIKRHFKWLMNPTLDYKTMFKLDLRRGFKKSVAKEKETFYADFKQRYLEILLRYISF